MLRHIACVVATSALMVTAAVAADSERADGAAAERWRVQIASLTTRDDAQREWRRLQGRHRDLLAALGVNIARAELDPGTFFRVQAGPIADRGAAAELCSALAARGQACLVVPAREPGDVVVTAAAVEDDADAASVPGPVLRGPAARHDRPRIPASHRYYRRRRRPTGLTGRLILTLGVPGVRIRPLRARAQAGEIRLHPLGLGLVARR